MCGQGLATCFWYSARPWSWNFLKGIWVTDYVSKLLCWSPWINTAGGASGHPRHRVFHCQQEQLACWDLRGPGEKEERKARAETGSVRDWLVPESSTKLTREFHPNLGTIHSESDLGSWISSLSPRKWDTIHKKKMGIDLERGSDKTVAWEQKEVIRQRKEGTWPEEEWGTGKAGGR